MRASSMLLMSLPALAAWTQLASAAEGACLARTGSRVTPVIELYTSEGCSSCPPADRWLSTLRADSGTVALAFHVDYWDRLGWKDRFASPEYTRRQAQQQASSGARFSYTPQVVVDGADRKDWSLLSAPPSAPAARAAAVTLSLARDGDRYTASVQALAPRDIPAPLPARLAAFWAVTEQDHRSAVQAGENRGATLRHDFVVREYLPVAAWAADPASATALHFSPRLPADPAHPRQINLVVVDAATGRPVQALKLGC